jgi:hypothetical protein
MKKIIGRLTVSNVQEMRDALCILRPVHDATVTPDVIYVTINSDSVRMNLIEETLTDGSKVYNIELSEVCK